MKIIRVVEAATGAPINVLVPEGQEGLPGPVNRSEQGDEQNITLADGSLVFNSTARDIGAATADLVDVDVFLTFAYTALTEEAEGTTLSLFAEVVDQDGGNIGRNLREMFVIDTADPLPQRVFCARYVGRIIGTGKIHARLTLGNGGDDTAQVGITSCTMSWIVRPILGTIFALT